MIVLDINLLVYPYNVDDNHHDAAQRWWRGLICGTESVGIPWVVSTGFVRVITIPGILNSPLPVTAAVDYVSEWFDHDHIASLNPGDDHMVLFCQNLDVAGTGTNLVTDAHIAAVAMEYHAEVHTSDADFARFPGLRWRNPLL